MLPSDLNNRGSSTGEECDIPPRRGSIVASAEERMIPPSCAWLHRVQNLVEMSTDCPLELGSGLVKLSQSCDKIITNRDQPLPPATVCWLFAGLTNEISFDINH